MNYAKILFFLAPAVILAQQTPTPDLVKRLSASPADHELIANLSGRYGAGVVEAFEMAFDAVKDPEDKALVAFNLIDDGVSDQKYFDYLEARARAAIDDDAPFPLVYDSNGKAEKTPNPEFVTWCKEKSLDQNDCARDRLYLFPISVAQLAGLADLRSDKLLLHCLESKNLLLVSACEGGLALLKDTQGLPQIAKRLAESPRDVVPLLAWPLAQFNDPSAEALLGKYVPDAKFRKSLHENAAASLKAREEHRLERGRQ